MRYLPLLWLLALLSGLLWANAAPPPWTAVTGSAASVAPPLLRNVTPPMRQPDPVPIQRVWLDAAQLAQLSGKLGNDAWVKLPRPTFEAQVQAASLALQRLGPQLLEARYQAEWVGNSLVGTADWTFDQAGLVLWPDFALPVRPNSTTLPINRSPIFSTERGNWLQIAESDRRCQLEWSLQAESGNFSSNTSRVVVPLPAAPVATLALSLPSECTLSVNESALIAGTEASRQAGFTVWLVRCGGVRMLELTVERGRTGPALPVPLKGNREISYTLEPDRIGVQFDWTPVNLGGASEPIRLVADSPFIWSEVRVPSGWSWKPLSGPGVPPGSLELLPGTASSLGTVSLSGYALPPTGKGWQLPGLVAPNVVLLADQVSVKIDRQLEFLGQDAGDYRLTGATWDGGTRLIFTGSIARPGRSRPDRQLPQVQVRPVATSIDSQVEMLWRPLPEPSQLVAKWLCRVSQGPVRSLRFPIPTGYQIVNVGSSLSDASFSWSQVGPILQVDLGRTYSTGEIAELRLEFRASAQMRSPPTRNAASRFVFPVLQLLSEGKFEGSVEVAVPPEYRSWSAPSPTETRDGLLIYRLSQGPIRGELFLLPAPSRSPTIEAEFAARPDGIDCVGRLQIQPSSTDTALILTPIWQNEIWSLQSADCQVEKALSRELAAVLACTQTNPWATLLQTRLTHDFPAEFWWAKLSRTGPSSCTVTARTRVSKSGPLLVPVLSRPLSAEPSLRPGELRPGPARSPGVYPILTSELDEPTSAMVQVQQLSLRQHLSESGEIQSQLTGKLDFRPGDRLQFSLPEAARLVSITLGGKAVDARPDRATNRFELKLPNKPPEERWPLEVQYTLPGQAEWYGQIQHLPLVLPEVQQIAPTEVEWTVAPRWRLWPSLASATGPIRSDSPTVAISADLVPTAFRTLAGLFLVWCLLARAQGRSWRLWAMLAASLFGVGYLIAGVLSAAWAVPGTQMQLIGLIGLLLILWRNRSRGAVALAVLCSALVLPVGQAQAPETTTVYLTANDEVYAPRRLLNRLAELARPLEPGVRLFSAEYRGQFQPGLMRIDAEWLVEIPPTAPPTWLLPLRGVRLQELLLDGQPLEIAITTTQGYEVRWPTGGGRRLQAKFSPTTISSDQEIRLQFEGPSCPRSRLMMTLPTGARPVPLPGVGASRTGQEQWQGNTWQVDLGPRKVVSFRWQTDSAPSAMLPAVRQLALWDLSEAVTRTTFALLYQTEQPFRGVTKLVLPPGQLAETIQLVDATGQTLPPNLTRWQPALRLLELQFSRSIQSGDVLLVGCYSAAPTSERLSGAVLEVLDAKMTEAELALRATGVRLEEVPRVPNWQEFTPDSLLRLPRLGQLPELQLESRPVDRVWRMVGSSKGSLPLLLRLPGEGPVCEADYRWQVGPLPRLQGQIKVNAAAPLMMLELDAPAVLDQWTWQAPDLVKFTRQAERVQLWFSKPQRNLEISFTATLTNKATLENWSKPGLVDLPLVRLLGSRDRQTVTLEPALGWSVQPEPVLREAESLGNGGWRWTGAGVGPTNGLRLQLTPPPAYQLGQLTESVQKDPGGWLYSGQGDITWPTAAAWELVLSGLTRPSKPQLQLPPNWRSQPLEAPPGQLRWRINPVKSFATPTRISWSLVVPTLEQTPEIGFETGTPPIPWSARLLVLKGDYWRPNQGPEGWQLDQPSAKPDGKRWRSSGAFGTWNLTSTESDQPKPGLKSEENGTTNPPPTAVTPLLAERDSYWLLGVGVLGWLLWISLLAKASARWWLESIWIPAILGLIVCPTGTLLALGWWLLLLVGLGVRLGGLLRRMLGGSAANGPVPPRL